MAQILFKSEQDVTSDWLFYIENEAKSLAGRGDFAIENYLDREIFNPEMQSYLQSPSVRNMLDPLDEARSMALLGREKAILKNLPNWLDPRFKKLKKKVKKVFCEVVRSLENLDLKEIIKLVLLALIPAFATGLPAAILPIIIGLLAYLIKNGVEKTCPA